MKKDVAENSKLIMGLILFVGITSLLWSYLFKINLSFVGIIGFFLAIYLYAFSRDEMKDDKVSGNFKCLVGTGLVAIYSTSYSLIYSAVSSMVSSLPSDAAMLGVSSNLVSSIPGISFVIDFILTVIIAMYLSNKTRKEKLKELENMTLSNLPFMKKEDEVKRTEPDIKIGTDIDTGEEVIVPHKDRYTHFLCLGPTGSGKTSQTIIPMINQDMQRENIGITVLEPKSDLAEKVFAMAKHYGKKAMYFNPIMEDCTPFNPCEGGEDEVIENITTSFGTMSDDSSQFFKDQNENLLRNALKVLKRLEASNPEKHHVTLLKLSRFLQNIDDEGKKTIAEFGRIYSTPEIKAENDDLAEWFLNDYFSGAGGNTRGGTKTYEHCSGVRTQISKLISNKHLRRTLCPKYGEETINFEKHLAEGGVIALTTCQGELRDMAKTLGMFLILQFQAAVFRRPLPESSRMPHFFYLDEFQEFSNKSFGIMLTQGRSYRVSCLMATQARNQIAMGRDGQNFLSLVSANARSLIIYPGIEAADAEYYSRQFGDVSEVKDSEVETLKPFDPFRGNFNHSRDVTVRREKVTKTRFSPSDIRFKDFGEITYCIVKNMTLQAPGIAKISYIPSELNDKLDEMAEEYRKDNERKAKEKEKAIALNGKTMYDENGRENEKNVEKVSRVDNLDEIFDENVDLDNDLSKDSGLDIDIDIDLDEVSLQKDLSPKGGNILEDVFGKEDTKNKIEIYEDDDSDSDDWLG